ncbi:hypothetical protein PPYR_11209 [Photinus pyralis]|uniref:Tetraspanin n=1 Tax=Photinus pyralis TaxID=7054 RepID=A0A5N4AAL8_PHOPY|nr:tetraspanin-9-like [Photinus pyralis]XP_031349326.1 tetraspanin-9-like [Photinus pyralis]KAB0794370.1 hypothetical protein PPYR_11209 [Photinus pyralis]
MSKYLIGVGAILLGIGFVGQCGATSGSTICLILFMFLVAGGIAVQHFLEHKVMEHIPHSNELYNKVEDALRTCLQLYTKSVLLQNAFDYLHVQGKCCGVTGAGDWIDIQIPRPQSCCESLTLGFCVDHYEPGCTEFLHNFIEKKTRWLPEIADIILGFQASTLALTLLLLITG